MNGPVAFLIDADNLCDVEGVRQALDQLAALAGPVTVRRAYGSADNLKGLSVAIRELAIQPCLTFPLSKNTTDAALVVGAMELACEYRPSVVAIGSGDLDFYPLAVRLRERGIKVYCFSQANKLHDEARAAYDQCFHVGTGASKAADAPAAAPVKAATAKKAPARKAAAKAAAKKAPATPAKKAAAKKAATASTKSAAGNSVPAEIQRILEAVPELRNGREMALNGAIERLHQLNLVGKTKPTKLFKKYPAHFELQPADKPNRVRWLQA